MRIGFALDSYKTHMSGVTVYVMNHKAELERRGHEVFVFTFGKRIPGDEEDHVIRSPGFLIYRNYYGGFWYTRAAQELLRTMDVVHIQHPFLSGQLIMRCCKTNGIPLVYTNHTRYDLYMRYYTPWMPEALGISLLKNYLEGYCRQMDLVICPSDGARRVLQQRLGVCADVEVIPNGVDIEQFLNAKASLRREDFGLSQDDFILVNVGRLSAEKNLAFLLEAFARISPSFPNAYLLLVGEGPAKSGLQKAAARFGIREKVRFLGSIPHAQLPPYYQIADLFVTSSLTEVHPLTLIEAMASGLPVLGIDAPGVSEIVENGSSGWVVNNDLDAYAAALAQAISSSAGVCKEMGLAARRCSEKYDIAKTAGILLSRYEALVEKRSDNRG